jgi:putative membrane protein
MMGVGLLIPVLLIGAVAYAAGWRPQSGSSQQSFSGQTTNVPLDILRERYARGEISGEEYQRMRQDLQS